MKISIVTISYNQATFLNEAIISVLNQDHKNIEYIIVDPGSTDGSREIIESYGDKIVKIFKKDNGPAEGLNNGFVNATGEIFCYLNSDDKFLPGAISSISEIFSNKNHVDVVCGHGHIIDNQSNYKRRVFSDSFSLKSAAYGASLAIQPSTFFTSKIFRRVGGFNTANKSNWDGELLIDMGLANARIELLNKLLSCYRVHDESITGTGRLAIAHRAHSLRMFEKIMNRSYNKYDNFLSILYRAKKHLQNPTATLERIKYGPVFGSAK